MRRGQLLELVRGFACSLRASGIRPGDTVNIADTNTVRRQGSAEILTLAVCMRSLPSHVCASISFCSTSLVFSSRVSQGTARLQGGGR